MLNQLLVEISKGNTLDINGLADRLATTPGMVKAMLEHLERSGALLNVQTCDGGCQGCGLAAQCQKKNTENRLWEYIIPYSG
ncbi:MAG: hypothetical protein JW908_15780 [Anaerolineales bacterium]|nr:hypothetical protein [Anaerolineales bacterium]